MKQKRKREGKDRDWNRKMFKQYYSMKNKTTQINAACDRVLD